MKHVLASSLILISAFVYSYAPAITPTQSPISILTQSEQITSTDIKSPKSSATSTSSPTKTFTISPQPSPTLTNTPIPTLSGLSLSIPDPVYSNPELLDFANPESSVSHFVNSMRLAGYEFDLDVFLDEIYYQEFLDKDNDPIVIALYDFDPNPMRTCLQIHRAQLPTPVQVLNINVRHLAFLPGSNAG